MRSLRQLPRLTHSVALGSVLAFGAQVLLALLMLKAFTPQDVGEFSVISQIAFFWMTLSLAQTPLSLLTHSSASMQHSARAAWRGSLWRMLALSPLALAALYVSQLSLWQSAIWMALLCVLQMAWALAQSWVLKQGQLRAQIAVRASPPWAALILTLMWLGLSWPELDGAQVLLLSALAGYGVGAAWWLGALKAPSLSAPHVSDSTTPVDDRPALLRMAHSLSDALIATALIVAWQRLYGTQETGWLSALLRVMGFIPAVVHMAWAQVMLSHRSDTAAHSLTRLGLHVALWASLGLALLSAGCWLAIDQGWLQDRWQGLLHDVVPLCIWQSAASLAAVFSYRPFQSGRARAYSGWCMALALLQALALSWPWWGAADSATTHLQLYAGVSTAGLMALSVWMARLQPAQAPAHP